MANRKASEEPQATALGSADFWAAVQSGRDVQISVGQILAYLRTVLVTADITDLAGKLQAISDTAAGDTAAAKAAIEAELGTAARLAAGTGAGQVPVLDANSKLDASIIPAVAITDTFPVASEAEMLALTAERGDIAIRSDLNKCFILKVEPATTLANWKELLTPTDAVLSVAGLKGAITAAALKTALAIAVADVSGLQAALDSVRTDFAAADTAIRSDMATALAGKFDKAGGNVTGATDFGTRPTVNGKAVWDAGNFDPTAKAGLGGAAFTGAISAPSVSSASGAFDALTVGNKAVWHAGNFDPSTKASLNSNVSFSALTVSGATSVADLSASGTGTFAALKVGTSAVWHAGNFDPSTKANLASPAFTGEVTAPKVTVAGAGSFGSLSVQNRPSWGGLTPWDSGNFDPSSKATLGGDASFASVAVGGKAVWHAGNFDPGTKATLGGAASFASLAVSARPSWANLTPWDNGNFDPNAKASLGAGVNFASLQFSGRQTYLYTDAGTENLVVRTGAANAYRYSVFGADGSFTAPGTVLSPLLRATGAAAALQLDDRAGGTAATLYQNANVFGLFMGADVFRVGKDGSVWSSAIGDFASALRNAGPDISGKFDKVGGQLTGDITLAKVNPRITFGYTAGFQGYWRLEADGYLYWRSAADDSVIFWIGQGGDFGSKQFGTGPASGGLNSRIEDRATAWARYYNSIKNVRLVKAGDKTAVDLLNATGNANGTIYEPFAGAVVTGLAADNSWKLLSNARWRYVQVTDPDQNWVTVAYIN
ncbi:hypothetical protein ABID82_005121 [Methylobacterium sp. PvP062]|uniref:Uncharacterized protein n=1 Tax=Methylobacterium radiotolerans TaxID=31998 RepID=A0ABV2NU76_9HYPH|nr:MULTISPECIES: hypothetical protein [unclassified Methylobacterium]MBP2498435.1 hypothetical protein [Methylobacterium sp. PvP105]MBP2505614.1 hypothetical protein [Methylobacterium sp. PvP109]